MSELDWNRYLQDHPIFSNLRDSEIAQLLDERVSTEKSFAQNQSIVKEGEKDRSIYLIGQGSADVFMKGSDGQDVLLNSLGKGDLIGELALFEERPRSATVIATEPCILLEFNGREFAKLPRVHPEIGFKLLVSLSERLRNLGDKVLNARLKDVDEKIKHVNAKLDTEIKVVDTSLKAAQTVFDQTNKRATEVIDSAERRSRRFTVAASTLGTIFTVLLAILSFMGYSKLEALKLDAQGAKDAKVAADAHLESITNMKQEVEAHLESIENANQDVEAHLKESIANMKQENEAHLKSITGNVDEVNSMLIEGMKEFYSKTLVSQFHTEMDLDIEKAEKTYNSILSFGDDDVSDALYRQIVAGILSGEKEDRKGYAKILRAGRSNTDRQKTLSYYLLLSTFILNDDVSQDDINQYNEDLGAFKAALEDSGPIKVAEADFGAVIFEEFIKADPDANDKSQEEKITKISKIWELIK